MNEDELKRKMDFIVEQQAQFVVDIHELKTSQQELATKQSVLTDALLTMVGAVGKLSVAYEQLAAKVETLTEAQAATDERLNAFIDVVERFLSERRNGNGN